VKTGVWRSVVVLSPNCPERLLPQARTRPSDVNARLKKESVAMAVTWVPGGRCTSTGVLLLVVESLPNCPTRLPPQASTRPLDINAKLWWKPPAMAVACVPEGRCSATGVPLVPPTVPIPNCP
jgi:uncharacterized protein YcgI (DUF1989 family)